VSAAKFTPGPWTAMLKPAPSRDDHGWRAMAMCGLSWMVAAPYKVAFECWDNEANARLIAAAPDLLDALEEAREGLRWYQDAHPEDTDGSDDEAMARIDAAIAKATGEAS
jgi:hypothetical protein